MDYLILLSSIAAGVFTVLTLRLGERTYLGLFNSFTGAYLLGITVLHLLPELYAHDHGHGATQHPYLIGTLILAGFFVQILLDTLSLGVEHGHTHDLHGRLPGGVVAGLCLHAFVEAIALGDARTHHDPESRRLLLWSIVVHNYPVSIALLAMLLQSGQGRQRALGWMAVFAVMAPLGMTVGAHTPLANYTRELTAVVVGIFMHIATTIFFEGSDAHRLSLPRVLAAVGGLAVGWLTLVWH